MPRKRTPRACNVPVRPEPDVALLTVPEYAYMIGKSVAVVWALLRENKVLSLKLNSSRMIPATEVQAFIERTLAEQRSTDAAEVQELDDDDDLPEVTLPDEIADYLGGKEYAPARSAPETPPEGRVLVHNHVRPAPRQGVRGFRFWTQEPDPEGLEECDCPWAPEVGPHFGVRRSPQELDESNRDRTQSKSGPQ